MYICSYEGDVLHRRDGSPCHPVGEAARFSDHGGSWACERHGLPRAATAGERRPDPFALGARNRGALPSAAPLALLPIAARRRSGASHGGGAFPLSRAIGRGPESRVLRGGHADAMGVAIAAGRRVQAGPASAPLRLAARVGSRNLVVAEQPARRPLRGHADAFDGSLPGRVRRRALPPRRSPKPARPRVKMAANSQRLPGGARSVARACRRRQRRPAPDAPSVPWRPIPRWRPPGHSFADRTVYGMAVRRTFGEDRLLERSISNARRHRRLYPIPRRSGHERMERTKPPRGERGSEILFRAEIGRAHV